MGRSPLVDQLATLRDQADAYRRGAIALDAKLRTLEPHRHELHALRERLHASAATLDAAIRRLLELPYHGVLRARLARR